MTDFDNAEAVTISGQKIIKESSDFVDKLLEEKYNNNDIGTIYGDTDSVVYETLVRTNKGIFQIGDLWKIYDEITEYSKHGHEIKDVSDLEILNISTELKFEPAKRLIRHKVSKKKYKICVDNKSVIMTEDHGCIVIRNNITLRVSPKDIKLNDQMYIVVALELKTDFVKSVECIGEFDDEYVYDIEMENDPHTFFANDILVHNSNYINAKSVIQYLFGDNFSWNNKKQVNKLTHEIDNVIVKQMNDNCNRISEEEFLSPLKNIEFKRESLCSDAMFLAKKRYILRVRNDEGVECDKFKYTGVDAAKNEFPTFIKNFLKEIIEKSIIDDWDYETYKNKLYDIKEQILKSNPEDIAFIKGYSTEKEVIGFLKAGKGAGAHAKAAIYHNQLIKELGMENKYNPIFVGNKLRFLYIIKDNEYGIESIGFQDKYPKEFAEKFTIDYKKMFDKMIISPLKRIATIYGWQHIDVFNEELIDIFDL